MSSADSEINIEWISKTLGIPITEEIPMEIPAAQRGQRRPSQSIEGRLTALENEVRFLRQRSWYNHEHQLAFQDYVSSQLAYLCLGRQDGPPPFQPAPYDSAYDVAQGAAAAGAAKDEQAMVPDIIQDAEDEDMAH